VETTKTRAFTFPLFKNTIIPCRLCKKNSCLGSAPRVDTSLLLLPLNTTGVTAWRIMRVECVWLSMPKSLMYAFRVVVTQRDTRAVRQYCPRVERVYIIKLALV
jgi:hypothetical protein